MHDPASAGALRSFIEGQLAGGTPMTAAMFDNPVDDALRAVVEHLHPKM